MIHIYEDSPDSSLSKLFLSAYQEEVANRIWYSDGATNLIKRAWEVLSKSSERVALYVDISPDNPVTVYTYNRLATYAHGYRGRMFVFPTLPSEYYFIRSVRDILGDSEPLRTCLHILPWRSSSLLKTEDDRGFAKSFEKFCKLFLLKAVLDCMKSTRGFGDAVNPRYGYYYELDCICQDCPAVRKDPLWDKARRFVEQYPIFPAQTNSDGGYNVSDSKALIINRLLCATFDELVDRLVPGGVSNNLIPLYSLSSESYEKEYKHYKLGKLEGSMLPSDYKKGIDLK